MSKPPAADVCYQFGPWRYQPQLRRLHGEEGEQRLKPLAARLLQRLLADPGKVLSREQLIAEVWTRKQVNDEVLSRAIAELRNLLGDDARQPKYIETLAKGGYRWIAQTHADRGDDSIAAASALTRPGAFWPGLVVSVLLLIGLVWALWPGQGDQLEVAELSSVDLLQARPLTAHPQLELDPRFDPIGRVVYVRADLATGISQLVMVSQQGDAERVLLEHQGLMRHPTVSPDGSEIALLRRTADGCELYAVSVLDQRGQRLADCAAGVWGGLEWTADGSQLLYSAIAPDSGLPAGIAALDRATLHSRMLTTPGIDAGDHLNPRLSPDQRHLVYASQHGSNRQLWRTNWPNMDDQRALLARPEPIYQHTYSPDGSALWVAGDLLGYRALNRLSEGQPIELLGGRGAQSIDLYRDGTAVWTQAVHDADVWIGRADQAAWRVLARSNRYESQPAFSADGQRLAMITNRGGTESIIVVDLADDSVLDLRLDQHMRWVRPTWSRDGSALIVTGYSGEQTQLYRYSLGDHVLQPLAEVSANAIAAVELPDRMIFLGGDGLQQRLLQRRNKNRSEEVLPLGLVNEFRASDGWLAWLETGNTRIQVAPMDRWELARPLANVDPALREAFAVAGDTLYYAADRQVWRLQLPDGEPEALAEVPYPTGHGPSLAVSSQGQIAIGKLESLSMDLMIAQPPSPPH